ncbi:MAG TPA: alpha/beta fold hydrolase [Syntrophomonadaceae bacterium]|nr:alpha/beta fold hydrolase [Syntrophomonadaceae bacterium]
MPVLHSEFSPPFRYRNAHIQSVFPSLFRKISKVHYIRQRVNTSDNDFLDLDWSYAHTEGVDASLAVLCHGLEGCSERVYMLGMAQTFNRSGIDAVSYNFRGCSGEPNLHKKFYTAGSTDDLHDVLTSIITQGQYSAIYLVGFSLGANLVLKYAGEKGRNIHPDIKGVAAISAPCDLRSSAIELGKVTNRPYTKRFLKLLSEKIREKSTRYPDLRSINLNSIRTLKKFDDLVTAPLSGYENAEDYWYRASCIRVLQETAIPTLILNAADDPMLGPECYPYKEAQQNDNVFLEVPKWGGHVGFMYKPGDTEYWHERRTVEFLVNT